MIPGWLSSGDASIRLGEGTGLNGTGPAAIKLRQESWIGELLTKREGINAANQENALIARAFAGRFSGMPIDGRWQEQALQGRLLPGCGAIEETVARHFSGIPIARKRSQLVRSMSYCRVHRNDRSDKRMKKVSCFLILLLALAQFDGAWSVAPPLPFAPVEDDNDEYLPVQGRPQKERTSLPQNPTFASVKRFVANFSRVRKDVPAWFHQAAAFAPDPLFVFMSLQI